MCIDATNLGFSYGRSRRVLSGVSLSLSPGRVTAVLGPNGAGKSTLVRLLAGVLTPEQGSVLLGGRPISEYSYRDRARVLALVPQRTSVEFAYTVREVVAMGRYAHGLKRDDAEVDAALRAADVLSVAEEAHGTLSAGQQQRAGLARALAQLGAGGVHDLTGRVLLADEPCSAMDASHTLRAMEHLRALAGRGLAVGVVLHDLSLVARFADEAALLGDDGTIALRDEAGAVLSSPVLGRVFGARFTLLSAPGLPPVPMAVNGADAAKSPRA